MHTWSKDLSKSSAGASRLQGVLVHMWGKGKDLSKQCWHIASSGSVWECASITAILCCGLHTSPSAAADCTLQQKF